MFCRAARDIAKGEGLKISYVGDPLGLDRSAEWNHGGLGGREGKRASLKDWFEGGCGGET